MEIFKRVYNGSMSSATIEEGKIVDKTYRILQLDNQYTVYLKEEKGESDFFAVASFDSLEKAREYILSLK
jgi:hypothetical protein